MSNIVLVGNPKADSKTLGAALDLADELFVGGLDEVIDIATFATGLLVPRHDVADEALEAVSNATALLVASPTYKGTYTGVLKLFLDKLTGNALEGAMAFPMMLGAGPGHAMAPELTLRPVLVELGASCPVRGLYLTEAEVAEGSLPEVWLRLARQHTHRGGHTS